MEFEDILVLHVLTDWQEKQPGAAVTRAWHSDSVFWDYRVVNTSNFYATQCFQCLSKMKSPDLPQMAAPLSQQVLRKAAMAPSAEHKAPHSGSTYNRH